MSMILPADIATYEIAGRQLIVLSILTLYFGEFLTQRINSLQKNNIPASVTGGLLCSIVVALLAIFGIVNLSFNLELRNLLLMIFFSTIGLNAKLNSLVKGGKALVILVIACGLFVFVQNIVGISVAMALGKQSLFGLFGGSISLVGGHGTAIAWGETVLEQGIKGVSEFGIATATFGLILGGLLGGPIAGRLVRKYELKSTDRSCSSPKSDLSPEEVSLNTNISIEDVIGTILALALCLGIGDAVNRYLFGYEIRLPGFLTSMIAGVVMTNLADPLKVRLKPPAIDMIGGVSLQLFLAMSLLSMDLLSLADSALLLLLTMVVQSIIIIFFAMQIVFRMLGRDYDAAVITGGFVGLGLGATPVAIANMTAVSNEHGPSVKALLVVPLVGAFFIDLINAAVIDTFVRFLQ